MDERVHAVVAFMRANMCRELSSREMSRVGGLSSAHLRRLFKRDTEMAPLQYLRAMRLARARELLEDSSLRLKEIAAVVGIGDLSHFVRNFKDAFGTTPTIYRAQCKPERKQASPAETEWFTNSTK